MRAGNLHIIQKQTIEIEFENIDDSFGVQDRVAQVFYENLQPRMEVLLDEMYGKDQYASIDKLEIDCGLLSIENWEEEFATHAILKMKEGLVQVNKEVIDPEKIEEEAAEAAFFFFLENGFMPWNKRFDSIAELEQALCINEKIIGQLKKLIAQKSRTAERLVRQFSKNFTSGIIAEITKDRENSIPEIFALLEKLKLLQANTQFDKHIVDAALLNTFASDENTNKIEQFFTFLLTTIRGNDELRTEIRELIKYLRTDKKNTILTIEKNDHDLEKIVEKGIPLDDIYISNAGLVLLHPFLATLFEHLKLTSENTWIDEDSQQKAVLALEFLASGKDNPEEFNLVLNKILCGFEFDEIVPTEIVAGKEIKTECEDLLKAVIQHWEVLKNTSITGLREAFLQRNGKLTRVDDGWRLQVEQKAIDVLLNNLPWGIGIVRLPWMNEMLHVEWA